MDRAEIGVGRLRVRRPLKRHRPQDTISNLSPFRGGEWTLLASSSCLLPTTDGSRTNGWLACKCFTVLRQGMLTVYSKVIAKGVEVRVLKRARKTVVYYIL